MTSVFLSPAGVGALKAHHNAAAAGPGCIFRADRWGWGKRTWSVSEIFPAYWGGMFHQLRKMGKGNFFFSEQRVISCAFRTAQEDEKIASVSVSQPPTSSQSLLLSLVPPGKLLLQISDSRVFFACIFS